MVSKHTAHPEQVHLEEKSATLLAANPDSEKLVKEIFGPMEEWAFQIAEGWKLMLIPFTRQWWFYDRIHEDWQETGYGAGEAVFYVEDNLLETERIVKENGVPQVNQPRFCTGCRSAIKTGDLFCRECGVPIKR